MQQKLLECHVQSYADLFDARWYSTPFDDQKRPTNEQKRPTNDQKRPTNDQKRPTNEQKRPTNEQKRPTNEQKRHVHQTFQDSHADGCQSTFSRRNAVMCPRFRSQKRRPALPIPLGVRMQSPRNSRSHFQALMSSPPPEP